MLNINNIKNTLNDDGFIVIDNFLDDQISEEIYLLFQNEKIWEKNYQERENHFSHVFKTENEFLPQTDEKYSASFSRSYNLENNEKILKIFDNHFKPILSEVSDKNLNQFDVRCHKLSIGDYYRTHIDDYTAKINLIYYVNKRWSWDWGGILNIFSNQDHEFNKQIFPKFNRVVLIKNQTFRCPHSVSQVHPYALYPRYSIVSFNK